MIRPVFLLPALLIACACATAGTASPASSAQIACEQISIDEPREPLQETALLLALPDCLDDPDPAIRDGMAFTTLSAILREGEQDPDTVRTLMESLLGLLEEAEADEDGFRGPFAILSLAEVARVDRITPFLSEEERWDLLMAGKTYLSGLTDYRGFSETEGWRHGVAHSADLLMQLSLNPQLTRPQAEEILAAIAAKAGTPDHAYVFGESERLAAPVIYLARQDMFTAEDWTRWFTALWPAGDALRENAYKSETALAKLHNLRAFAEAVYVSADASTNDAYAPVRDGALALLASLP